VKYTAYELRDALGGLFLPEVEKMLAGRSDDEVLEIDAKIDDGTLYLWIEPGD
jgi:hypothetical protein